MKRKCGVPERCLTVCRAGIIIKTGVFSADQITEDLNLMKIRFSADSTCDMNPEFIARYQVESVPLSVELNGKLYKDGVNISPDDIITSVNSGSALPKTAAVNVSEYREVFTRLLADCDAVLHFNISSEFSSCWQNACAAAEGLPVYCIDSRNLSSGMALLLAEAHDLAEAGMPAEAIAAKMPQIADRVDTSFFVDRLDYLYKGGRCSMLAMLGANVLHIRPGIEVTDGKMVVGRKYRGTFERCMRQYISDRLKNPEEISPKRVFLTHSGITEEALNTVYKLVMEIIPFSEVYIARAGCSITSHCGDNAFGILMVRK